MRLLVLVPIGTEAKPPEGLPLGRAALALAQEGIDVVFADAVRPEGWVQATRARPGGWEPTGRVEVAGLYDRFPSQARPREFARTLAAMGEKPCVNPAALTYLCRDKIEAQRHLEGHGVRMPSLAVDPSTFPSLLAQWGEAFLKPRLGSFGEGVMRVVAGDDVGALMRSALGAQPHAVGAPHASPTQYILQRAVPRPQVGGSGVAGLSWRILVQRVAHGWWVGEPVARWSTTDPVANAARGAQVGAARDYFAPHVVGAARALAEQACAALCAAPGAEGLAEVGVDIALDPSGRPYVLEVNGKPLGHLGSLAAQQPQRFGAEHLEACVRPLRWLAHLARR